MIIGIDVFKEKAQAILKNRNIALITGSSNCSSAGEPVYAVVKRAAGARLKCIWALQHGFFIDKQDNMILSDSFYWQAMDIPIRSLYADKLLPDPSWLEGIDAVLIDVFDVGTRVYTFVNHVLMIMKHFSGRRLDIIVLDRPNPLNGMDCEGNVLSTDFFSIVGFLPVPMRHSLSTAEFLSFGLHFHDIDLQLETVKIQRLQRERFFKGNWTYPSPNMPSLQTAVVYPGAVLLEGTNISEARGTTRPFEMVGAPFIDNFRLADGLGQVFGSGVNFIPVFFKPEFSKFAGEVCKGVLVQPTDWAVFESFAVYYELIRLVMQWYPNHFQWKQPPYEFEYKRLPIDMICGSSFIREALTENRLFAQIEPTIRRQIKEFKNSASDYLLY